MTDDELSEIKGGERYFHYGYLVGTPPQPKKHLRLGQAYMIKEALNRGCTLINKNGTKISVDILDFSGAPNGRAIYPKRVTIEA